MTSLLSMEAELIVNVHDLLCMIREGSGLRGLRVEMRRDIQSQSLFDTAPGELKERILQHADASDVAGLKRAMGSLAAMAIADSIGHNFEFMPVRDAAHGESYGASEPWFEYPCATPGGKVHNALNTFGLEAGVTNQIPTCCSLV